MDNILDDNHDNLQLNTDKDFEINYNISNLSLRRSQSPVRSVDSDDIFEYSTEFNVNSVCREVEYRHNSSTRQDFLEEPFLSASPTVNSDSSDMNDNNKVCGKCSLCLKNEGCMFDTQAGALGGSSVIPTNSDVLLAFAAAMGKVEQLTNQVKKLDAKIVILLRVVKKRVG